MSVIHYLEFKRTDNEDNTVYHFQCGRSTKEGKRIVKPYYYYPYTIVKEKVTCKQCLKALKFNPKGY